MANVHFRISCIPVSYQSDIEIFRTIISHDGLYGCEMGHLSFMEEQRLGLFENRAVHGTCVWICKPLVIKMLKLHNKKHHSS